MDNSAGETILLSVGADYARRIVACVNACAGLATDDLEKTGLVSAVGYQLIELEQQRDELLAALKVVRRWIGDGDLSDDDGLGPQFRSAAYQKLIDDTDATIAKADLTQ